MSTIAEVQYALRRLDREDRYIIACWLERYQEEDPSLTGVQEPALEYSDALLYMTEEEYLAFEESSPTRHEYVNGYVHAMCGATMAHSRVVFGLQMALAKRLGGGPCESFSSGLKLKVDTVSGKEYLYPDIMVSCDRAGWREKWLLNPRLIVEVLSPSTQHIDRREKATTYRSLPSVEEYVIAAQSSPRLTIFRRAERWTPKVVNGPQAVAEFRSIGLSIPLAEIYRGVFPGSDSGEHLGAE